MLLLENTSILTEGYDTFIWDIAGTLVEGAMHEPSMRAFVEDLQRLGKTTVGFSNNPRPSDITQAKLTALGYNPKTFPVFTSGDIFLDWLRQHCRDHPDHRFYHLGTVRNEDLFRGSEQYLTPSLEHAYAVVLTSFTDLDENTLHKATLDTLHKAHSAGKIVLCVNPDKTVINPQGRRTAGYYASYYETLGGNVRYFGKPDQASFAWLFQKLFPNGKHDKDRTIMIGDNMETDILGAHLAGIHSCLVLTGVSTYDDALTSPTKPNYVWESLSLTANLGRIVFRWS